MRHLVNQFAEHFVENTVEMAQDMMSDCPEDYASFKDVDNCLNNNLIAFADDNLDEYLKEFCEKVRERVKAAKIKVHVVQFNQDGFVNMDYEIKLEIY